MHCTNKNIKLKANFLGPKAENSNWLQENIKHIFDDWCQWRENRFPEDSTSISRVDLENQSVEKFQRLIFEKQKSLSNRFEEEVPKYSPRYMGHMVSEISLPALFGHIVALLHNPNNSSFSAAKVGIQIEQEAISSLSAMLGYNNKGIGHFTSGGTIANIEALWRARYRLDHSLSFGAYQNVLKKSQYSLFEASHLEIDTNLNIEETKKYSFVEVGAYQVFSVYKKVFGTEFKGPILITPGHKHYSWQKAVSLLGLGKESLWTVDLDHHGHLCLEDLRNKIELARTTNRPILAVVSVAGTTELGMVDPIHKVQDLLDEYKKQGLHIWHHVDGAYGGIFASLLSKEKEKFKLSENVYQALSGLKRVESITLDPHKLAMVPYACGAIIVKDTKSYVVSQFHAPYLKEKQQSRDKWVSTLEGSRPATGASATWMLANTIGLNRDGMGELLTLCLEAKNRLINLLNNKIEDIRIIPQSDTNIIGFTFLDEDCSAIKANQITKLVYEKIIEDDQFSVSQTTLNKFNYKQFIENLEVKWSINQSSENLYLIRMVMMNPFSISKENKFDYLKNFTEYLYRAYSEIQNKVNSLDT